MSFTVSSRKRASTRGEQPEVFSLRSRRRPSRPTSGGSYAGRLRTDSRALSMAAPRLLDRNSPCAHLNRMRVSRQSLRFREHLNRWTDSPQPRPRNLLYGDELHKIQNVEPPAKSRRAARRQDMIRTRRVIARRLRRIIADKHRSRISHQRNFPTVDGKMFGGNFICPIKTLSPRSRDQNYAFPANRLACHAIHPTYLNYNPRDISCQLAFRRNENCHRLWIMFRLRHQIGGNKFWSSCITHDEHFRWPRQEIDRAIERHLFLGDGDVNISRADNLIHARNALRPEGERRDRLCPADSVDFANSKYRGCRQYVGVCIGRNDANGLDARNLSGNHRHQQSRNQ